MENEKLINDEVFTVAEVADYLKTNTDYVYRLKKSGLLKFIQIGRLKCRKSTLDAFLEKWDGWDISDPFNPVEIGGE